VYVLWATATVATYKHQNNMPSSTQFEKVGNSQNTIVVATTMDMPRGYIDCIHDENRNLCLFRVFLAAVFPGPGGRCVANFIPLCFISLLVADFQMCVLLLNKTVVEAV